MAVLVEKLKAGKLLMRFDWPDGRITRLLNGTGPYMDPDGKLWRGAGLVDGSLDAIDKAINGDAASLPLTLSGVSAETGDAIWNFYQVGNLKGAQFRILFQFCDSNDQPTSKPPLILFWAIVDDVIFDTNTTESDEISDTVTAQLVNRFTLRRNSNGSVMSDADQRIFSKNLNPAGTPDRYAERVVLMQNKTRVFPRYS